MIALANEPVEVQRSRRLHDVRSRAIAGLVARAVGFAFIALSLVSGGGVMAIIALIELVVITPGPVLALVSLHGRMPGEPLRRSSQAVEVAGELDAIATRVRRAFVLLNAVTLCGSSIRADRDQFRMEGGTNGWGHDEVGHNVKVRVEPADADQRWLVTIESMNFMPSWIQGYRNRRNVLTILDHLVA